MKKYCNMSWKEVIDIFDSNIYRGLSNEDYIIRKRKYGDNKIHLPGQQKIIIPILKSFTKMYILISILICGLFIYYNEIDLALISGSMIILNLIVKIYLIILNRKKLMYLQRLNKSTVKVLRNGVESIVKAEDLVKGDIVIFSKGSLLGADIRIIEANDIKVDEKNITGENYLKDKFESKIDGFVDNIADMKNILFKGSIIKDGSGIGVVVETGRTTQLGRVMSLIAYADNNKQIIGNRIEKKISNTSIILVILALLLSLITGNVESNLPLSLVIISSLPICAIIVLHLILLKKDLFEEDDIELINFSTLDLINNLEYIFLDKIGSITKNEMIVKSLFTNDKIYEDSEVNYNSDVNIKRMIDVSLLCNDATYNITDDNGKGNISEIAILRYAAEHKIYKSILDSQCKRIFQIPMDSDKRILTTVNKYKKGYRANIRGNVDAVLERCTHIMVDGIEKELTEEDLDRIKGIDYNLSVEGLISQGIAYRSFSYQPSISENVESNLVFVGIIALENPLNDNIKEELIEIEERGLKPIIFTEDNRIAAVDLGRKINLINDIGGVISGVEMESLSSEETKKVLAKVRVFSRITPELKGKIVGIFTRDKYNVATTGESLGELPSLTLSKVGIGKGNVPEIVKKVCDVYIKENFLTGFLKLFDISKVFNTGLNKVQKFIFTLLTSEIILINIFKVLHINEKFNMFILLNFLMIIPLSLIILKSKSESKNDIKKFMLRTIIWISVPVGLLLLITEGLNIISILTLGVMIIIFTICDSKVSLKKISRELFLVVLSIILLLAILTYMIMANSVHLSQEKILIIVGIIIIYLIIELIMMKWQ